MTKQILIPYYHQITEVVLLRQLNKNIRADPSRFAKSIGQWFITQVFGISIQSRVICRGLDGYVF